MNTDPVKKSTKAWAILLRLLGLAALILAAILNRDRAGDWLFRSDTFSERYAPVLLACRLTLTVLGIFLLTFASRLVNRLETWWRALTTPRRIAIETLLLACFGMVIFALSVYFRENLVPLEQISRHKIVYKMLGFNVIIQDNPWAASDFFVCIFLSMAALLSYLTHSLLRHSSARERGHGIPSPGQVWVILSFGFFYAALDEYFAIHEFIGDNVIKHRDDLVMLAYAVLAIAVLARYVKYLASFKPGFYMLALGALLQALAMICDRFAISANLEEGLEELAAISYLGGVAQYLVRGVLSLLKSGEERAEEKTPTT